MLNDMLVIESFDGEEIVPVIILNDNWCKPLSNLGLTFEDVMTDSNQSIVQSLWRRDVALEGEALGTFNVSSLDKFCQNQLTKWLGK